MFVAEECKKDLVAASSSLIKEEHAKLRSFHMPGITYDRLSKQFEVSSLDVVSLYNPFYSPHRSASTAVLRLALQLARMLF